MRIALLSYRTKTHSGGQGVYVRNLSRALVETGHEVTVFSAQPYPEDLHPKVDLVTVPSLDLYREDDPFRTPSPREFRGWIDVLEYLIMITAGFPEPLTFSLRIRRLAQQGVFDDFDVVHDNQSLGYGLLWLARNHPFVATIHHPISRDRRLDIAAASWRKQVTTRRWYGFVRMQARVARRLPRILGVSTASAADTITDFGLDASQLHVVPLGVDTDLFAPSESGARAPGRIVVVASADVPLKGVSHFLDAAAKVSTEHELDIHLVSNPDPDGPTARRLRDADLVDIVTVHRGLDDETLADLIASAELMVIPSLYEGFSLPAVEAMACGTPLVASRAGALPEVIGTNADSGGVLVEAGDVEQLVAAIGDLLDDPARRAALGAAGRARAERRFSWHAVARRTVEVYASAITDTEEAHHADR